jgi:phosphoribosylglycinamide formyltransferase 1
MTIGIIASSNGGVFKTVVELLRSTSINIKFIVVTDRECGIEDYCEKHVINWLRIDNNNNQKFSKLAADYFLSQGGVDLIFLFFLRLVTSDIYSKFPTVNIHPSLLPLFKGFNPVEKTILSKSKFLGVTAHLVDESIDSGSYIAQGVVPYVFESKEKCYKISYLQKIYIMLVVINQLIDENLIFNLNKYEISFVKKPVEGLNFNPKLTNQEMTKRFFEIEELENIRISA